MSSAAEYDDLIADLISSGVIADAKMAYFDVRPSAHVPTLELRVCDACPIVDDAVLIAGLFRAMVLRRRAGHRGRPAVAPVAAAAASRGDLAGRPRRAVGRPARPPATPAACRPRSRCSACVERLRPQLEELGDWDEVADWPRRTLPAATPPPGSGPPSPSAAGSRRRRPRGRRDPRTGRRHRAGRAGAAAYRLPAGDEAVGPGRQPPAGVPRDGRALERLGPAGCAARRGARDDWIGRPGLTFGVERRASSRSRRPGAADHPRARLAGLRRA